MWNFFMSKESSLKLGFNQEILLKTSVTKKF